MIDVPVPDPPMVGRYTSSLIVTPAAPVSSPMVSTWNPSMSILPINVPVTVV